MSPQNDNGSSEDLTGKDRMVRNVLVSWAGHLVFIAAGLITPRLIDRQIGAEALGVWDFGWALVNYFHLVQMGVVASINRYVARYRAIGDADGVNRSVSSVFCVLLVVAVVVLLLTGAATLAVPGILAAQLRSFLTDARWVIFLLGSTVAVQFAFSSFAGVLSGCHRWGLKIAILLQCDLHGGRQIQISEILPPLGIDVPFRRQPRHPDFRRRDLEVGFPHGRSRCTAYRHHKPQNNKTATSHSISEAVIRPDWHRRVDV